MSSVEDIDLRLSSMDVGSAISKSPPNRSDESKSPTGSEKPKNRRIHQFIPNGPKVMLAKRKHSTGGSKPRIQLICGPRDNLETNETRMLKFAKIALSSFNAASLSKQGPEYELVVVLDILPLPRVQYYHCNFIAKLKNETEAEDMLFFAELKPDDDFCSDGEPFDFCCHFCCILGPVGSETGRFGAKSCCERDGVIFHPESGFTSVHFENGLAKLSVV